MINDESAARGDANTEIDSAQSTLESTQPYRTPVNVGDSSAPPQPHRSAMLWGLAMALGLAVAAGGYFATRPVLDFNANRRPVQPLDDFVEEFGYTRSGPIDELDNDPPAESVAK